MTTHTRSGGDGHTPTIPSIDEDYLRTMLRNMLAIPSPTGYTDNIVRFAGHELDALGLDYELTRRGAIRATIPGKHRTPNRALVAHLDTLGAMVTQLKPNGRLAVAPVGTWSSRFAEGARVTIFTDTDARRGTILPLLASGHVYHEKVDTQPICWDNLEIRIDHDAADDQSLYRDGFRVGDYVAIDPQPEFLDNGYIVSRHLDDKAGVACILAAANAIRQSKLRLPVDCHLLFTISEEVGSGASAVLHQDAAEMVSIDNATNAPGQNAHEDGITIAMMDSSGPYDYHLTHKIIDLAHAHGLALRRDVFRHYRSDAASAVEAGNDIRTALLCFGLDASHGYERTHIQSLTQLAQLLTLYMQSAPAVPRDRMELGPIRGFPRQHTEAPPVPERNTEDPTQLFE